MKVPHKLWYFANSESIVQLSKEWEFIAFYKSIYKAWNMLEIDRSSISKVLRWKRKSAGGYKFLYQKDYKIS